MRDFWNRRVGGPVDVFGLLGPILDYVSKLTRAPPGRRDSDLCKLPAEAADREVES